jgi:hypothetical protein
MKPELMTTIQSNKTAVITMEISAVITSSSIEGMLIICFDSNENLHQIRSFKPAALCTHNITSIRKHLPKMT